MSIPSSLRVATSSNSCGGLPQEPGGLPAWVRALDDVAEWLWSAVAAPLLAHLPAKAVNVVAGGLLGLLPAPRGRRPRSATAERTPLPARRTADQRRPEQAGLDRYRSAPRLECRRPTPGSPSPGVVVGWCGAGWRPRGAARGARRPCWRTCGPPVDQSEHLPEDQVQQPQRHAGIMSDRRSSLVSDPGPTAGTPQGRQERADATNSSSHHSHRDPQRPPGWQLLKERSNSPSRTRSLPDLRRSCRSRRPPAR